MTKMGTQFIVTTVDNVNVTKNNTVITRKMDDIYRFMI